MALPLRVVLPYINHTDIAASVPQRVWFLRRFGLKTGIDFTRFDLELSMVIQECMNLFVVLIPNE